MAQQLRAVEFNEGEPLDPNKLNDLKHNIIVAYEEAVKNTSDTGQVTRFDSGFVLVDIKKGVGLSTEISLGTLPGFQHLQQLIEAILGLITYWFQKRKQNSIDSTM